MMVGKKGAWVVEVREAVTESGDNGDWIPIAECDDSTTAIAIGDALHTFMQTGLTGNRSFQTQTRMATGTP